MAYETNILIGDRYLNRSKRNLFNSFIRKENFETKLTEKIKFIMQKSRTRNEYT